MRLSEKTDLRAGVRTRRGARSGALLSFAALLAASLLVAPASGASFGAASWGQNLYRQLGDGSFNAWSTTPVAVSELSEVTAVAAGGRHSLALRSDGTVLAWGSNEYGELGDGTTVTSNVPVPVSGLTGVIAIAAGANHSLALLSNGTVMAWGDNEDGQLGNGSALGESLVPVAVKGLSGVRAIAGGGAHSLALLSSGAVVAWGSNEDGQLGNGTVKSSTVPVNVKGLSGASAVAAGGSYSLALLSNGTVMAWGSNEKQQLGNAAVEENSTVPVAVSELNGVSAISAGGAHSLALIAGAVEAWGENRYGDLGDGVAGAAQSTPVAVSGLGGVSAVAAGENHSLALLSDGTVKSWGEDVYGQLGNGAKSEFSDLPVAVVGLGEVAGIAAGAYHSLAFGEPLPTVAAISPASGGPTGGTSVTISGANLAGASAVRFGAASAASFTVNSATSLTAVSPAGSGTVDVTVTTPAGISPRQATDRFTYVPPPEVKALSPNHAWTEGGTSVKISGAHFTGATSVRFGAVSAVSFTVTSTTVITAVAPAEPAGKVDVTVTAPPGTSAVTTKDRFSFTPTITGVTPNHGAAAGGASVTITGTGFVPGTTATTIKFGTKRALSLSCASSTECTARTPAHEPATVDVRANVNRIISPIAPGTDKYTFE